MENKRYTRIELERLGMTDEQIDAALSRQEKENEKNSTTRELHSVPKKNTARNAAVGDVALKVTSISDLQSYAKGTLVRFPDFAEGQPFIARVRRPSMLVLAKQGKIPNALLSSANELFNRGGDGLDEDNVNMLADVYDIMKIVCEAALQEPTYQQIADSGLSLSDNQMMAIFNYTQTGVKALEQFR